MKLMLVCSLSAITAYYLCYEANDSVKPLSYYDLKLYYEADNGVKPLSYYNLLFIL